MHCTSTVYYWTTTETTSERPHVGHSSAIFLWGTLEEGETWDNDAWAEARSNTFGNLRSGEADPVQLKPLVVNRALLFAKMAVSRAAVLLSGIGHRTL